MRDSQQAAKGGLHLRAVPALLIMHEQKLRCTESFTGLSITSRCCLLQPRLVSLHSVPWIVEAAGSQAPVLLPTAVVWAEILSSNHGQSEKALAQLVKGSKNVLPGILELCLLGGGLCSSSGQLQGRFRMSCTCAIETEGICRQCLGQAHLSKLCLRAPKGLVASELHGPELWPATFGQWLLWSEMRELHPLRR